MPQPPRPSARTLVLAVLSGLSRRPRLPRTWLRRPSPRRPSLRSASSRASRLDLRSTASSSSSSGRRRHVLEHLGLDELVRGHGRAEEGLAGRDDRKRQECACRTEQGGPDDDAAERDRRMQLHRPSGQWWRDDVVLDLLIEDDESQHEQRFLRADRQRDEDRQCARDVRADVGMNWETTPTKSPSVNA